MERNHIIYFHPDKPTGFGVTTIFRWPKRVIEQGLDESKAKIIYRNLTKEEANEREPLIQRRHGYPNDKFSYSHSVRNASTVCQTEEAIKKRVRNTDYKERGKNVDWFKVNGSKDNKAIQRHRMMKVVVWTKDGKRLYECESEMEAGRRTKVSQGNINSAVDQNRYRKGYRFTRDLDYPKGLTKE